MTGCERRVDGTQDIRDVSERRLRLGLVCQAFSGYETALDGVEHLPQYVERLVQDRCILSTNSGSRRMRRCSGTKESHDRQTQYAYDHIFFHRQ